MKTRAIPTQEERQTKFVALRLQGHSRWQCHIKIRNDCLKSIKCRDGGLYIYYTRKDGGTHAMDGINIVWDMADWINMADDEVQKALDDLAYRIKNELGEVV